MVEIRLPLWFILVIPLLVFKSHDCKAGGFSAPNPQAPSVRIPSDTPALTSAYNCVSLLKGSYFINDGGLSVDGPVPLDYVYSYDSDVLREDYHQRAWGWSIGLPWRFGYLTSTNKREWSVMGEEKEGFMVSYLGYEAKKATSIPFSLHSSIYQHGYTNLSSGSLSGQTFLGNHRASYQNWGKHYEWGRFEVVTGSGSRRIYEPIYFKGYPQWRLAEEVKPNGHIVHYSYLDAHVLKRICTTSPDNSLTFNFIDFAYDNDGYTVTAQNGQFVRYQIESKYMKRKEQKGYIPHLQKIIRTDGPTTTQQVAGDGMECNWLQNTSREWPDGRFMNIVRQGKNNNVMALEMPAGTDSTPVRIASFTYNPGSAEVRDAYHVKTTYRFSSDARIAAIEKYNGSDVLESSHLFFWKGPLLSASALSTQGECLTATVYSYDGAANVTQETLYGNLTGQGKERFKIDQAGLPKEVVESDITVYKYTKEGFNLRESERHSSGLFIEYEYRPNTNLVTAKLTGNGQEILAREFYTYDTHALLIEAIKDDGVGRLKDDITGATTRLITRVTPRLEAPAVGFAAETVELCVDLSTGLEHQLKRSLYHYNQFEQLIQEDIYDAEGNFRYSLFYTYDDRRNLVLQTDALGRVLRMSYDDNKNKISEEMVGSGVRKTFSYDYCNRLIKEEEIHNDGLTLVNTYSYDLLGNKVGMVDPYGHETLYAYDEFSRLIKTTQPAVPDENGRLIHGVINQEYDVQGNCVSLTDPVGNTTSMRYNTRGQPIHVCYPDGTRESTLYTIDGKVAKHTDKTGMITCFEYDVLGRTTAKQCYSPSGERLTGTTTTYLGSHLIAETDGNGNVTEYCYDNAGRQIAIIRGETVTTFEYDSLGRKIKMIENGQRVTSHEYDLLDRVIEERIEDNQGNLLKLTRYGYDFVGNLNATTIYSDTSPATSTTLFNSQRKPILITDALGNSSSILYNHGARNSHGHQVLEITATDPLGQQTVTTHDVLGRIASVTKRNSFQDLSHHEIVYDLAGRPIHRLDSVKSPLSPDKKVLTSWIYNSVGQLLSLVEAKGSPEEKVTRYRYNMQGQQEAVIYPDGLEVLSNYDARGRLAHYRASDNSFNYLYHYDANNNVTTVESESGTTTCRDYDYLNRMVKETLENGLTLTYAYDCFGRISNLMLPDGSGIQYTYDPLFLRQVQRFDKTGEPTYSHHYLTYDLSGHCTQAQLATGQIETYTWDKLGRPIDSRSSSYSETAVEYDAVGNLLERYVIDSLGPILCHYQYDPLYQLRSESGLKNHHYSHDSLFNRLHKDDTSYTVNSLNELLQQGNCAYSYDPRGYLASRKSNDISQTYRYDGLGRLTAIENPKKQTITYSYDAFNRRLSKSEGVTVTRFLYAGQNEIGAVDSNGRITELRILGVGLGAEIGAAISVELGGDIYVPQHDHNGNVTTLLDLSGKVVEVYRYSGFGEETLFAPSGRQQSTLTAPKAWWPWSPTEPEPMPELISSLKEVNSSIMPWRFASKRVDEETGWIYFGRRHYDPSIGRWVTPDPLGFAAGPNLYAYVNNSPLTHFDLYGLYSQTKDYKFDPRTSWNSPWRQSKQFQSRCAPYKGYDLGISCRLSRSCTLEHRQWELQAASPSGRKVGIPEYASSTSFRIEGKLIPNVRVTCCPGVGTDVQDAIGFARLIHDTHGGCQVDGIYNHTGSVLGGCIMTSGLKNGHNSCAVYAQAFQWISSYHEMHGYEDRKIIHWAHSMAAQVADNAVKLLPPHIRNCIDITGLGGAKIIPRGRFGDVTNVISSCDWIPALADSWQYGRACMGFGAPMLVLPGSNWFEHSVLGETYSGYISNRGHDFQKHYMTK